MKNRRNGFTLVELLAVLVVLGVVMVFVAPMAFDAFYKARRQVNEMEAGVIIDAGKLYLTDLDKGKKEYIYQENSSTQVNGHTYSKGNSMTGYDLKVYLCNNVVEVDLKTLVTGGYYDELCEYDKDTGEPSDGCRLKEECVLDVQFECEMSPDGVYYSVKGYNAEINRGCEK